MELYFVVILWCFQVCFAFSQTDQFPTTRRHKQLRGYHLVTKSNVNKEIECIFECQNYQKCWSINYHSGQQICQLNKIVSQTFRDFSLVDAIGWNYFEKKEVVFLLSIIESNICLEPSIFRVHLYISKVVLCT